MTIRTVTLSPGFDHAVHVDHIEPGGMGKVHSWKEVAAGKGVNVARVAHHLGAPSVAYSLVGQPDEREFASLIAEAGPRPVTVAVPGPTRRNLTLSVDSMGGAATHAVGARLATGLDADAEQLLEILVDEVELGDIVTLSGAVPEPIRSSIWVDAAVEARARGAIIVADTQGDALISLLATGIVKMAKPNEDEARVLDVDGAERRNSESPAPVGSELMAAAAIRAMLAAGVETPVVTLGAHGLVHVRDGSVVRSWCEIDRSRVHVGAGDAFVAGYCVAVLGTGALQGTPTDVGLAVASAHVAGATGDGLIDASVELLPRIQRRSLSTT